MRKRGIAVILGGKDALVLTMTDAIIGYNSLLRFTFFLLEKKM